MGERAAIALALSLPPALLLMDDRAAAALARTEGIAVAGALGILELAARRGMIDLGDAIARRQGTNFRRRRAVDDLLARQKADRRNV